MFNKILVCYDGSREAENAVKVSGNLAKKFGSSIHAVYVAPDFKGFMDSISVEERNIFTNWIDKNLIRKQTANLDNIKKKLAKRRITFSYDILNGLPYIEILKYVKKNQFGMVALGKGRFNKNNILGGTALKLIKNSDIPILIVGGTINSDNMKNVLLPTDIFQFLKKDLDYARGISGKFKSTIHLFNVVETGDHNIPVEVLESMKGSSYNSLSEYITRQKLGNRFSPVVRVAKNAWIGINDYVNDNKIDIMLLNTYGGKKIRTEHIGSIAEKVIEHSTCPVMAIPGKL